MDLINPVLKRAQWRAPAKKRKRNFGYNKRPRISRPTDQLLDSQKQAFRMALVAFRHCGDSSTKRFP